MITISLTQGLGNQLFQYFFGESLKLKFNNQIEVNYLYDLLPPEQIKMWELFDVKINWLNKSKVKESFLLGLTPKKRDLIIKFFRTLNLNKNFLVLDDKNFDVSLININKNIFLRGYWQNINFFSQSFDQILKNIKFKNNLNLNHLINSKFKIKNFKNIIGVHIRGKDYLLNKNSGLKNNIGKTYYLNSMSIMKNKLEKPLFLLFSDDQDYLKKMNLSNYFNCLNLFDISNDHINDFQYLSQCNYFIIPNSTFSLWAFYLNKNPNKKIIAPDTWYSFNENCIEKYVYQKFLIKN